MKIEFNANKRELQGTGASRRLRRAGKVPGILYGGETAAQPIEVDHNQLFHQLKLEAFHASVLSMNLDGQQQQVLLRDYQMHAFKPLVLHADFQRVAADRKIHMKVPLHFINTDIAPGVKLQGGVVSHVLNELNVVCLPAGFFQQLAPCGGFHGVVRIQVADQPRRHLDGGARGVAGAPAAP